MFKIDDDTILNPFVFANIFKPEFIQSSSSIPLVIGYAFPGNAVRITPRILLYTYQYIMPWINNRQAYCTDIAGYRFGDRENGVQAKTISTTYFRCTRLETHILYPKRQLLTCLRNISAEATEISGLKMLILQVFLEKVIPQ